MISCRSIIGTAVIEIENGIGLGSIHQVLVDNGVLLTFVVKTNQADQPYALLPGKSIHGIGDFAAMIKNGSALQAIDEAGLNVLNDKQGGIFEETVITVDGNKIGKVVDFHIDPTHEVGVLMVQNEENEEEIQIPKAQILMIGKEYIILNEEQKQSIQTEVARVTNPVENNSSEMFGTNEEAVAAAAVAEAEPVTTEPTVDREAILAQFDGAATLAQHHHEPETVVEQSAPMPEVTSAPVVESVDAPADRSLLDSFDAFNFTTTTTETAAEEKMDPLAEAFANSTMTASIEENYAANEPQATEDDRIVPFTASTEEGSSFLQEQKKLLVGKRLQKDLVGADGNTILYAEEVVTDATIDLLRRIDRKLVVRLAGCVV